MSKFELKNAQGSKAGEVELVDSVYGIEPNVGVMHQVVRSLRAGWRQGTHATKSRGMVSGGGKKPWRQKGTGRARQGSTRSPQWVGGGVVFGPQPRSYKFHVNNKEVKLAMRSALSAKLRDEQLVLVEDFGFTKPSTKEAVAFLKSLGLENKKVFVVIDEEDDNAFLSFRNIPGVFALPPRFVTTYDLIDNECLLMTGKIAEHFGEVLQ